MSKPNRSAAQEHEVSDLIVSGQLTNQNNSTVIGGTTTVTMRDGPVVDEPTILTLGEKDISVYFDPVKSTITLEVSRLQVQYLNRQIYLRNNIIHHFFC